MCIVCAGASTQPDSNFVAFGKSLPSHCPVQISPVPILLPPEAVCRCNYRREKTSGTLTFSCVLSSRNGFITKHQLVREHHPPSQPTSNSKSYPDARAILSLLLFKERLLSSVNFPIIRGGRLSILLLDKSMVLRLLVSFCNSEGNWRKGAHSAGNPSPVNFTAPATPCNPQSGPSQPHSPRSAHGPSAERPRFSARFPRERGGHCFPSWRRGSGPCGKEVQLSPRGPGAQPPAGLPAARPPAPAPPAGLGIRARKAGKGRRPLRG